MLDMSSHEASNSSVNCNWSSKTGANRTSRIFKKTFYSVLFKRILMASFSVACETLFGFLAWLSTYELQKCKAMSVVIFCLREYCSFSIKFSQLISLSVTLLFLSGFIPLPRVKWLKKKSTRLKRNAFNSKKKNLNKNWRRIFTICFLTGQAIQ